MGWMQQVAAFRTHLCARGMGFNALTGVVKVIHWRVRRAYLVMKGDSHCGNLKLEVTWLFQMQCLGGLSISTLHLEKSALSVICPKHMCSHARDGMS